MPIDRRSLGSSVDDDAQPAQGFEHRTEWPLVAVALMVGGITLVGTVTVRLAPWIVQSVAEEDTANEAATRAQIAELREEIRRLELGYP